MSLSAFFHFYISYFSPLLQVLIFFVTRVTVPRDQAALEWKVPLFFHGASLLINDK